MRSSVLRRPYDRPVWDLLGECERTRNEASPPNQLAVPPAPTHRERLSSRSNLVQTIMSRGRPLLRGVAP